MKAEIKADGTLVVSAENEIESFALKVWLEDYGRGTGSNEYCLQIDYKYSEEA